ncbi:MAG: DUF3348 family protein [Burkholderiaceae bacterium]
MVLLDGAPGTLLRANFNQSALVRQLGEGMGPGPGSGASAGQDFAERLGAWLSVADSIALRAALQATPTQPQARRTVQKSTQSAQGAHAEGLPDLLEEVRRVRATLAKSITTPEPSQPRRGPADHSPQAAMVAPAVPLDPAAEFAMLHQRYGEQQRRMEMSIDALRAHARDVLSQASPELARLAALDAMLDQMLGGREQHLLSTVPAFLKKRFEALRRQAAADAQTLFGHSPEASGPPGWLVELGAEFEQALLAELDLRLQPLTGLAEALANASH